MQNKKLNIVVNSAQEIINPAMNLQVRVFQNQRSDNFEILKDPSQITAHKIMYNQPSTLDFKGNNGFRTLDLRSTRSTFSTVQHITRDSIVIAKLNPDQKVSNTKYEFMRD